jgi:hypothetical protein
MLRGLQGYRFGGRVWLQLINKLGLHGEGPMQAATDPLNEESIWQDTDSQRSPS